jgi:hypothetical protein
MNPTTTVTPVTTNSWAGPDSYVSGEPRLKVDLKSLTHDNVYWDDSFSNLAYIYIRTLYQRGWRNGIVFKFLTQVAQVKESQYPLYPSHN